MKTFFKLLAATIVIILVVSILGGTYLDISREELETKYATGNSNFIYLNDGARIHYRDEGNKKGPVILLLHGFNGSLFNFELIVPQLEKDFRLISLDLPAFGLTGAIPSADYTMKNFIKTIFDFTKRIEIQEFIILGNSMGGNVAWSYALDYPEQVKGLILIGSGGIIEDLHHEDLERKAERTLDDSPIALKIMSSDLTKFVLRYFTPKFFAEQGLRTALKDEKLVTDALINQFHGLVLLEGSRQAILSMNRDVEKRFAKPDVLKDIVTRTLIIHGEEDNLINVANSKYYQENIPELKVKIYTNIGHMPMYEDPIRTAKDVKEFIKTLPGIGL